MKNINSKQMRFVGLVFIIFHCIGTHSFAESTQRDTTKHPLLRLGEFYSQYLKADHGATLLQGSADDTVVNELNVNYYGGTTCNGEFLDFKPVATDFTFVSGRTYYADATGLYELTTASTSTIRSIRMHLLGTTPDPDNDIEYCITNVTCTAGPPKSCSSSVANTSSTDPYVNWSATYPS